MTVFCDPELTGGFRSLHPEGLSRIPLVLEDLVLFDKPSLSQTIPERERETHRSPQNDAHMGQSVMAVEAPPDLSDKHGIAIPQF
jgi:hypothetical protein